MEHDTAERPRTSVSLAEAMEAASIDAETLAGLVGVSEAAAQRWVAGEREPNRRQRTTIATLVNVPTRKLWPGLVDPAETSTEAEYDKVIGIPAETWTQLVVDAEHHIDMVGGGYGWWLEQNPTFTDQIRSKQAAGSGIQIRICQADPYGPLVQAREAQEAPRTTLTEGSLAGGIETAAAMWADALATLDNAELRVSEHAFEIAIYRFDDWLITSPYLLGQRGLLTYADLVHRNDVGTKFDQLITGHFEPLWQDASTFHPKPQLPASDR